MTETPFRDDDDRRRANWPHAEPFAVVDGVCQVCGYDYEYGTEHP